MNFLTGGVARTVVPADISSALGEDLTVKRILIIRPNSRLGNQLLLTPLLQEIEAHYPECKIDLFVRGNIAPIILENYRNIDRFIKLPPKPFKQLIKYMKVWLSVRAYCYDIVFNVEEGSSSGRLLTKMAKSKLKLFGNDMPESLSSIEGYVHYGKKPVYNFRYYLSKKIDAPVPTLSLKLSSEELAVGKKILKEIILNDKPTICIYTFATGAKCYPKEWWQHIYDHLRTNYASEYNILEVLPKENVSQIDFQATTYYSRALREMGAVISNSSVFITGDCGVMHLASSTETPTVAFFSITNTDVYAPYNKGSIAINSTETSLEEITKRIDDIIQGR